MADQHVADNFISTDNTAAHAATQAQHEAAHNLLADSFKMPEPKSVSSNMTSIIEGTAITGTGAAAGAAVGLGLTAGMGVLTGVTGPFLLRKSVSDSIDLGVEYGLKTIMPRSVLAGTAIGFGAYELLAHTLLKPSDKK